LYAFRCYVPSALPLLFVCSNPGLPARSQCPCGSSCDRPTGSRPSVPFLSHTANTQSVPKLHVALPASHAAPPPPRVTNISSQCCLQTQNAAPVLNLFSLPHTQTVHFPPCFTRLTSQNCNLPLTYLYERDERAVRGVSYRAVNTHVSLQCM
jgi:hypothetical protein